MLENIIAVVTIVVSYILGKFTKKSKFIKDEFIPIQNLLVGILASIVYYLFTKDFSVSIMAVGLFTGGTYDIFHNIDKMFTKS